MVTKEHTEHQKALHRAVYNDWGLYQFVQMLAYKCVLAGKTLAYIDERESSKRCSRCGHSRPMPHDPRTYRCQNCGLVMDRDENSAVNHYQRFFARLPSTHGRSRAVCGCIQRNGQRVTTLRKADWQHADPPVPCF